MRLQAFAVYPDVKRNSLSESISSGSGSPPAEAVLESSCELSTSANWIGGSSADGPCTAFGVRGPAGARSQLAGSRSMLWGAASPVCGSPAYAGPAWELSSRPISAFTRKKGSEFLRSCCEVSAMSTRAGRENECGLESAAGLLLNTLSDVRLVGEGHAGRGAAENVSLSAEIAELRLWRVIGEDASENDEKTLLCARCMLRVHPESESPRSMLGMVLGLICGESSTYAHVLPPSLWRPLSLLPSLSLPLSPQLSSQLSSLPPARLTRRACVLRAAPRPAGNVKLRRRSSCAVPQLHKKWSLRGAGLSGGTRSRVYVWYCIVCECERFRWIRVFCVYVPNRKPPLWFCVATRTLYTLRPPVHGNLPPSSICCCRAVSLPALAVPAVCPPRAYAYVRAFILWKLLQRLQASVQHFPTGW